MTPFNQASRRNERLAALTLLMVVLFSPPLLIAVDRLPGWASLTLYLFAAWGSVIGLTAWLMERSAH